MATKSIPDEHHVVRHCKKKLLIVEDGQVHGAFPEAFELRPASETRDAETYLSAIYFEFTQGTDTQRMKASLAALQFSPKRNDGLMKMNAGKIKEEGSKRNAKVRVLHEAKKLCPAYATIRGMPSGNSDKSLLAALALLVSGATVAVSSV